MKKQVLLAVGVIALFLAAKEYGIRSVDDLKAALSPYLRAIDLKNLNLS